MNPRILIHTILLAVAGVLTYGAGLWLLSGCSDHDVVTHDAGDDARADAEGIRTYTDSRAPDARQTPDASPSSDTGALSGDGGAGETPDAYCTGFTDAGYLAIDGSTGFRFPWLTYDGGAAEAGVGTSCSGFGCWYACEAGPCPQSSNCAEGLACIVSPDASLANPDSYAGTCGWLQ
jgi:hypothetical protein